MQGNPNKSMWKLTQDTNVIATANKAVRKKQNRPLKIESGSQVIGP